MTTGFIEASQRRLRKVLKEKDMYDFPDLIFELRRATGIHRTLACSDMNLKMLRMHKIEHGDFADPLRFNEMKAISEYYGISDTFLQRKCDEFLLSDRAHDMKKVRRERRWR